MKPSEVQIILWWKLHTVKTIHEIESLLNHFAMKENPKKLGVHRYESMKLKFFLLLKYSLWNIKYFITTFNNDQSDHWGSREIWCFNNTAWNSKYIKLREKKEKKKRKKHSRYTAGCFPCNFTKVHFPNLFMSISRKKHFLKYEIAETACYEGLWR